MNYCATVQIRRQIHVQLFLTMISMESERNQANLYIKRNGTRTKTSNDLYHIIERIVPCYRYM